jgi:hypothetical protein
MRLIAFREGESFTDNQALAVVDRFLERFRLSPDLMMSNPPPSLMVAGFYAQRGVRLERVPELIKQGLKEADRHSQQQIDPEMVSPEMRQRMGAPGAIAQEHAALVVVDYHLARKEAALARAAIEAELARTTAGEGRAGWRRSQMQLRLARVAELEERFSEAETIYRRLAASLPAAALEQSEFGRAANRFYLWRGGTEAGFDAWLKEGGAPQPPARGASAEIVAALPPFSAPDLAGRKWTLDNLLGKATLVNYWRRGAVRAAPNMWTSKCFIGGSRAIRSSRRSR